MFGYITGKVKKISNNFIILDNNGIGYIIYVSNPYSFEEEKEYQVWTYNFISESENSLYGFKLEEEKELFLKLINVKGLGPKTAIAMMATGSVSGIIDAITRENILYLTKFPKVGEKLAKQIILDLKNKFNKAAGAVNNSFEELTSVLESLGYKSLDIKKVLPKIDPDLKIEEQVKEALKLMLK